MLLDDSPEIRILGSDGNYLVRIVEVSGVVHLHVGPEPEVEHVGRAVVDDPRREHLDERLDVAVVHVPGGDIGNPPYPANELRG
jgi:hypothetical protein